MNKKFILNILSDGTVKKNECLVWLKRKDRKGYGLIYFGSRSYGAHRLSAFAHNILDDLNSKLFVCHKCDNPPCVNPKHLFLGTAKDNIHDSIKKDRFQRGTKNRAAKLNEEEVKKIFVMWESGLSTKQIADRSIVNFATVTRILRGKLWKHLGLKIKRPMGLGFYNQFGKTRLNNNL